MEAFNTGDTSNVPEFISDDHINRESQGAKDSYRSKLKGLEEFVDTIRICVVPSLTFIMKNMKWKGNKAIFVGSVTGTHKGNFFFIPPIGNKIGYEAIHIHTMGEDGKM